MSIDHGLSGMTRGVTFGFPQEDGITEETKNMITYYEIVRTLVNEVVLTEADENNHIRDTIDNLVKDVSQSSNAIRTEQYDDAELGLQRIDTALVQIEEYLKSFEAQGKIFEGKSYKDLVVEKIKIRPTKGDLAQVNYEQLVPSIRRINLTYRLGSEYLEPLPPAAHGLKTK